MKRIVSIVSGCLVTLSALAADTGVRPVSSVTTTNRSGAVYTTETFVRGSDTNLVRTTGLQGGAVVYLSHRFYHNGDLVASTVVTPNGSDFQTMDRLPYQVSLTFWPSKEVRNLHINGRDFNERFDATNGVFYPAPDSDLVPVKINAGSQSGPAVLPTKDSARLQCLTRRWIQQPPAFTRSLCTPICMFFQQSDRVARRLRLSLVVRPHHTYESKRHFWIDRKGLWFGCICLGVLVFIFGSVHVDAQ